jgi:hypothetical protein
MVAGDVWLMRRERCGEIFGAFLDAMRMMGFPRDLF